MHKGLKFCTAKEAVEKTRLAPHPFHRVAQFTPQMRESDAAHIAKLDPFEVLPEVLVGVQLRGIRRQALQVQALCCASSQALLDEVATVNGRAIPHDDHAGGHFAQQVLKKGHDVAGIEGAILAMEVQLALRGNGADGGEMIEGPPFSQNRGLPSRRIGTYHAGQGVEAGFIYEEEGLLLGCCPFLMAGHVSVRQRAIAASSRWRAQRMGF